MTRQFLAALLSLSLGLTAMTTAPARADEDVAKVLAGLAVIGILSQVLKNDDHDGRVVSRNPVGAPKVHRPHKPRRAKVAPRRCIREQWTHRGTRDVYGARCMKRHAKVSPPRNCLRRVETRNGVRKFYAPRCLRKNGWRA